MSQVLRRSPEVGTAPAGLVLAGVGGVMAAFFYVATVVPGGAIVPGYSYLRHSVSELTSPGAPYRTLLALGFLLYNIAVALLGVGLLRSSVPSRWSRFSVIAAIAILVTGAIGAALITSPVFGLLERLTQLSFLSWFAGVGVLGLRRAKR